MAILQAGPVRHEAGTHPHSHNPHAIIPQPPTRKKETDTERERERERDRGEGETQKEGGGGKRLVTHAQITQLNKGFYTQTGGGRRGAVKSGQKSQNLSSSSGKTGGKDNRGGGRKVNNPTMGD